MPRPRVWESCDALVADLKAFDCRRELEHRDWPQVIRRAVAPNTFRAFRRLPRKPSEVFRNWALDAFVNRGFFERPTTVSSPSEYDLWLAALVGDFQQDWQGHMGSAVPYGPSYKLPNLLLKFVTLRPEIPAAQRERLIQWLHIPLDSYTILALRSWFVLPGGRRIPPSATMSFISDAVMYEAFQSEIRRIAELARVPPITFDYLAWDAGYQKTLTAS